MTTSGVTCMAYLSEEVAATHVMQHSVTRALLAKTYINKVYGFTMALQKENGRLLILQLVK